MNFQVPSAFLPETWPFSLDRLPKDACLVGGSVRDQLLQRQSSYLDLDFIVAQDAIEIASKLATECDAGFVVLDRDRQIARVVFDRVTVDIAQQQGESLAADLRRRDFTINAIAYHPLSRTFVDPLGGRTDIERKTIRMVSPENLAADPLRLMRGYRQAAQLGFTIEPKTQATIHQLAPRIKAAAIERIRSELDALLSAKNGSAQLTAILKHRLLSFCLPHFTAGSIEQIKAIEKALTHLHATLPGEANRLQQWLSPVPAGTYRSWLKATKVSRLLSSDPTVARTELTSLSYSRAEIKVILCLLKAQPAIDQLQTQVLSRSEQFFLFKLAAETFPAVALLALSQGVALETLQPMMEKFSDPTNAIAHPPVLLTGNDIMQLLGMKSGRKLGALMKAVEQAQAAGEIHNKSEAIAWLKATVNP